METKEEQELGVICSWMEEGASQHCLRRRHRVIVQGMFLFFFFWISFNLFFLLFFSLQSSHLSLILPIDFPFFI